MPRRSIPKFGRLFKESIYRPQVELLGYLREHGFKNFIVSGGGIDLIRAFAEEAYGIPREQVVGSSVKLRFEMRDGRAELMKLAELNSFDDREVKPANIGLHIGRRPILAFGNSDGDLAMLRYCKTGKGARLALLIHHDDAEREVAYDREFRLSPLVEALDKADEYGITVVSMKKDWKTVFAPARSRAARRRMKEWLVYLSEHAIVLIDFIALIVIVFGTVEAVVGARAVDAFWIADRPRAARGLAALRALAGRGPDLPARRRHHRDRRSPRAGRRSGGSRPSR